jgi:Uma2 family endonuclease
MTTQTKKLTYEEWLAGPEIKARYEIVDGEVIMPPAPVVGHQRTLANTYRPVYQFVFDNELGEVLFAPVDVVVQQDPLRVRQPDLFFIRNDNPATVEDRVYGGPDLVVEILSPSNNRSDIESRLADYARIECQECWVMSSQARTVEVLRLQNREWVRQALYGSGDVMESRVLTGFKLNISDIFRGA